VKSIPALASPALRPVKDLLGKVGRLFAGEGALYVRPAPGRVPEVTLVTEPSAGTDGAALLDRILSGADLRLPIHRSQVAGVESRTIPFGGGFGLHYANVGRNLVVSDLAAGIAGFADGGPGLAKSGTYSDALTAAGTPKQVADLVTVKPRPSSVKTVLLSADFVSDEVRTSIREAWGAEVFEHYGMTEMGLGCAVSCEYQNGYHVREADLYLEIIDPDTGKTVPDGDWGEIVFTSLTRVGMPFIRYRTGDISRWKTETCRCGSKLKLLDYIQDRNVEKGQANLI
jgi:hypothetical protein